MRIAVLGDTHIPGRAREIPRPLMERLAGFGPQRIWFTGDFTSPAVLESLDRIGKVDAVFGNMDASDFGLPESLIFEIEDNRVCIIHGDQVQPLGDREKLEGVAKYFKAGILVYGHTHTIDISQVGDVIFINPGSATGAPSGGRFIPPASLVLMEIVKTKVDVTLLTHESGRIEEKKYVFCPRPG